MKTIRIFASVLVAAVLVSAQVLAGGKKPAALKVDTKASTINWLAKKVTGQHMGTIGISAGDVVVEKGKLVGGSFTIDMKSIVCTDIENKEYNQKFIGHITTGDFFEVDKFPTATFKITKVDGSNVTGDLTIKGVTQSVSFPAVISVKGDAVSATAKIDVDRTKFGIKYGSKSFFASIGDKAIDDTFALDIKLVAAK
jgi:polyisoprenoid-binding protein YceI